jgi:hypothetical protein
MTAARFNHGYPELRDKHRGNLLLVQNEASLFRKMRLMSVLASSEYPWIDKWSIIFLAISGSEPNASN